MRVQILPLMLGMVACSEQELKAFRFNDIAMVEGDFDHMGDVLLRLDIDTTEYEGYITKPVYDDEIDPDSNVLKVEALLRDRNEADRTNMLLYDAVFLNSGVRGLGEYVYDGVDPDDTFLSDEAVIENVQSFVGGGRTLVVSDWAGDIIEAAWPDTITFMNEDICTYPPCWDASQVGVSERVQARIIPDGLQVALDTDTMSIDFDFSYWTAIAAVSDDVEVYLRGDIEYRISDGEGYGTLEDVPLLVGFTPGNRGRVIFSSFHWRSQNPMLINELMVYVVEGLNPGPNANLMGE